MPIGNEAIRPGNPEPGRFKAAARACIEFVSDRFADEGPPSIFIGSAEGVTTFPGKDGDPNWARTQAWLDCEFAKIGAAHPEANASLRNLRQRQIDQVL